MKFVGTLHSNCFRVFRDHWPRNVIHLTPMFSSYRIGLQCKSLHFVKSVRIRSCRVYFCFQSTCRKIRARKKSKHRHLLYSASFSIIETFDLDGVRKFISFLQWRFLFQTQDFIGNKRYEVYNDLLYSWWLAIYLYFSRILS